MILGIGIDSTEIDRFIPWTAMPKHRLQRIFSDGEIDYCFNIKHQLTQAKRLAARFAVREALYKALHQVAPRNSIPLLTLCKKISVEHKNSASPQLIIDWNYIHSVIPNFKDIEHLKTHLSITHTRIVVTVLVILEH
jgi:phosphopantetheine--protein transferase-like protein